VFCSLGSVFCMLYTVIMFDKIENKKRKETYPFLEWMDRFVLTEENLRQARDVMYELEAQVSELSQVHRTPQSANHHAEGPMMTNHIENMIAGIFAICEGKVSLSQIEEFAREKHFKNEIAELEDVICENAATLKAFTMLHDIAKYDTISFSSPAGSKGAAEGFSKDSRLDKSALIDRYLKLLNAFKVDLPDLDSRQVAIDFYKEFEIKVHYKGHAKVAVSDKYEEVRNTVEDLCRLTARDREILALTIKYHIEVMDFIGDKPDGARYSYLQRVGQRSGIDGNDLLDVQTAALLLDALIGSIGYQDGALVPDIELVLNMLRSEELAVVERRHARVKKIENKKQSEFKKMLESVGLGGGDVFKLLDIPFGPGRAGIIDKVQNAVKTGDLSELGEYKDKLYSKVQQAHLLYATSME